MEDFFQVQSYSVLVKFYHPLQFTFNLIKFLSIYQLKKNTLIQSGSEVLNFLYILSSTSKNKKKIIVDNPSKAKISIKSTFIIVLEYNN
jgi:hypothetical protein